MFACIGALPILTDESRKRCEDHYIRFLSTSPQDLALYPILTVTEWSTARQRNWILCSDMARSITGENLSCEQFFTLACEYGFKDLSKWAVLVNHASLA